LFPLTKRLNKAKKLLLSQGIADLGDIQPRQYWPILPHVLTILCVKSNMNTTLLELYQSNSTQSRPPMLTLLERILETVKDSMRSIFIHLFIAFAFAHLHHLQKDIHHQLVCVPANFYCVDPYSLEHYWAYNFHPPESSSNASVPPHININLSRFDEKIIESLKILNLLFMNQNEVDEAQSSAIIKALDLPNAFSLVVLAITVNGNYKQALELTAKFIEWTPIEAQRQLLQVQQMQLQIALRVLPRAFQLCFSLITKWKESINTGEKVPEFPVLISQQITLVPVEGARALLDFLLLSLFHICWIIYVGIVDKNTKQKDFLFIFLIIIAQSAWEPAGFGLFQQFIQHITLKKTFRCQNFLNYLNNSELISEIVSLKHVSFELDNDGSDPNNNEKTQVSPDSVANSIVDRKITLSMDQPVGILERFLVENHTKFLELFSSMK